ncbi:MAG TPA: hypothetical protein P5531_13960 [Bacteroidales bacterium]|nr:hypothetical protein [Bacteroidales bacterium]HSA44697.1 hypothetical protein [Bacteroidales bacterium]
MRKILTISLLTAIMQCAVAQTGVKNADSDIQTNKALELEKKLTQVKVQHLELKKLFLAQQQLIDSLGTGLTESEQKIVSQKDSMQFYCNSLEKVCARVQDTDTRLGRWKQYAMTGIILVIAGGICLLLIDWMQRKRIHALRQRGDELRDELLNSLEDMKSQLTGMQNGIGDIKHNINQIQVKHSADINDLHDQTSKQSQVFDQKLEEGLKACTNQSGQHTEKLVAALQSAIQTQEQHISNLQKKVDALGGRTG